MGGCCSARVSDAGIEQLGQQQRGADASDGGDQQQERSQHAKGSRAGQLQADAAPHRGPTCSGDGSGPGTPGSPLHRGASITGRYDDIKAHYAFDRVLGRGQFGVTRLVVDHATGERCACKSISKRKLVSAEDMEDVRREIRVMHHLSGHPHVVTFRGAFEDSHHIHIVMELCTGGELFEQLSAKGYYRERDAAHIMRTVLQVVQHCHAMNVVHRDLKPENFLFLDERKHILKAIDFGLSTFWTEGAVLHDLVGSPYYMAPEVLRRQYGPSSDVWSCGVILYILLCGWPPFYGSNAQQIFRAVLHDALDLASPPWDSVSPQAKDCVRRMLVRDPRKRPDAHAILGHEWLRGGSSAPEAPMQPEILNRMRRFAGMNRFKKEALRVVATHLPPEEVEGIRQMFTDLDADGSGTISFAELREGLRRKGATVADGELQRIMAQVDLDGNHTLDFQEFLTATVFLGKLQRREHLMAAFQFFDADGSGFISQGELMQALQQEGVAAAATIASILETVDRDGDARIDYEEFLRMMVTEGDPSERRRSRAHGAKAGTPGRPDTASAAAAALLPGSTRSSEERAPHHHSAGHHDSEALHILHGVKSGAWAPWGMASEPPELSESGAA